MTDTSIDLDTIDIYLIGDDEEIAEGIKLIDAKFRNKIIQIIRYKALTADKADLFDIYQEVLTNIFKYAKNKIYNPDAQKLEGLIGSIAHCRATDWIRRTSKVKVEYDTDRIIESTKEIICGSKYHEAWQVAYKEEKRGLILATIRNVTSKLKKRQRQVAEIIIENSPNILSLLEIKKQILHRYDEDVTTIAVKRAREEVRNKITESLERAGYGDYIND